MAKRKRISIGATLSLNNGNFFTNLSKANGAAQGLKTQLEGTKKTASGFGTVIKKAAGVAAAALGAVTSTAAGAAAAAVKVGDEYKSAINSIGAQTGATGAELSELKQVMKDLYADNYGESFGDIAAAITTVKQTAKGLDSGGIKDMTENALALSDTFSYGVEESVRAANMLTSQFGMNGTEAFNLIAQGAQRGLDKNGDLLDVINEYSVHFKQIGLGAEEMFNMLENGAASGAFSVDKLGDAVKEFGIKVKEDTADEALKSLGFSANFMKQAFAQGGAAAAAAFSSVNSKLFTMTDKLKQNTLGVQLYGTMWEDVGADGVRALANLNGEFDRTKDSMEQLKEIRYDDLGSAIGGIKRLLVTKLLLPVSEELTPAVTEFAQKLRESFDSGALAGYAEKLAAKITGAARGITAFFGNIAGAVRSSLEACAPAVESLKEKLSGIGAALTGKAEGGGADFITSVVSTAVPLFVTAMNAAAGAVKTVIDHWNILGPLVKGVVAGFAANSIIKSIYGIYEVGSKAVGAVKLLTKGLKAAKTVSDVAKAVSGLGGSFKAVGAAITFFTTPAGWVVAAIAAIAAGAFLVYKNWDKIKEWGRNVAGAFKETFSVAKEVVQEKIDGIKAAYEENGGGIKGIAAATVEGIKSYYTAGFDFLDKLTGGKLSELREKWLQSWSGIGEGLSDFWKGIKEGVKGMINSVISYVNKFLWRQVEGINTLIGGFNSVSAKIGMPAIPTITAPQISLLAEGGILTRPTLFGRSGNTGFVGGEAGQEAVLPLDVLWRRLDRFAERLGERRQQSAGNVININIYADGMSTDEIAGELVAKLKLALANI